MKMNEAMRSLYSALLKFDLGVHHQNWSIKGYVCIVIVDDFFLKTMHYMLPEGDMEPWIDIC